MENETYTDDVTEATPKNRPRKKRERQSSTPESVTRAQTTNEARVNMCQDTLHELNSKTDTLLPILSQISKLQENVEQLLKESAELKKAIEFNNNCEIEDLKK